MAYTVGNLLDTFRREVDDPTYFSDAGLPMPNTLWSNYQLIQMLDDAQREWAERTLGFKDSKSFNQDITAGESEVEYDQRIIKIEKAELASDNREIELVNLAAFSMRVGRDDYGTRVPVSWNTTTGTPTLLITDLDIGYMRLWPEPTEDDELLLATRRRPLATLVAKGDDLEVPEAYQLGLLNRVRRDAYSQPKALQAGFAEAGLKAAADWEDFLLRCSSRISIRTRRPGKMRYGGL